MGGTLSAKAARFVAGKNTIPGHVNKDVPEFSAKEKQLIRSSWEKLDAKSSEVAADIFLRIFELRPDVKSFFPFSTAVGDALVNHSYFKGHSVRFLNAVRMTVSNMDAWEVIHIPNLRKLGQYHTKIEGFSHDIFQVFYHAMNDVWSKYLGRAYNKETKVVWCKIFKFIVDQVELGYHEEVARENALPETTPTMAESQTLSAAGTDGASDKEVKLHNSNSTLTPEENKQDMSVNDINITGVTTDIGHEHNHNNSEQHVLIGSEPPSQINHED